MRALVTGCAGFIGSHLTDSLLSDGIAVLGVDCFNDNYERGLKLRNLERAREWDAFEFLPVDLSRRHAPDVIDSCDVIFHLAAEPGVRASWGPRFSSYVRNNIQATQKLLEALRYFPEKRLVNASSSSIYGQSATFPTPETALPNPLSPYGVTKLAAESLCDAYHLSVGTDIVNLRLFTVYGPRQRPDMACHILARAALAGEPLHIYGSGDQTRDFTFVDDVVAAFRRAAESPQACGQTYNVGGGTQISLNTVVSNLAQLAGRKLEVIHTSAMAGDAQDTGADTSKARATLGFEPRTSFDEGLAAEWDWVRSVDSVVRERPLRP